MTEDFLDDESSHPPGWSPEKENELEELQKKMLKETIRYMQRPLAGVGPHPTPPGAPAAFVFPFNNVATVKPISNGFLVQYTKFVTTDIPNGPKAVSIPKQVTVFVKDAAELSAILPEMLSTLSLIERM